jgi:transposase
MPSSSETTIGEHAESGHVRASGMAGAEPDAEPTVEAAVDVQDAVQTSATQPVVPTTPDVGAERQFVGIKEVPIESIEIDEDNLPRACNSAYVGALAEALGGGSVLREPTVDGDTMVLVGGLHTLTALRKTGHTVVKVRMFRYQSRLSRYLHAVELNSTHGLRFTTTENRRIAVRLFKQDGMSIPDIAKIMRVSVRTVAAWTRACRTESREELRADVQERHRRGDSIAKIAGERHVSEKRVRNLLRPSGNSSERAGQTPNGHSPSERSKPGSKAPEVRADSAPAERRERSGNPEHLELGGPGGRRGSSTDVTCRLPHLAAVKVAVPL